MRTHGRVVRRQAKGGREHAGELRSKTNFSLNPVAESFEATKKDLSYKTEVFKKLAHSAGREESKGSGGGFGDERGEFVRD